MKGKREDGVAHQICQDVCEFEGMIFIHIAIEEEFVGRGFFEGFRASYMFGVESGAVRV